MDFKSYLQVSVEEINQEMDNFFQLWKGEAEEISSKLTDLNQSFIGACQGGKRLRGTLVKLGYEIASKIETKDILKPAAACEIFNTAILAQDDIIDKSPLRRGKPSLYYALGGSHYGISQTICLSDIGFFISLRLIAETNFPEKEKNLAIQCFIQIMLDTALGEMLDVEISNKTEDKSEKDVITLFKLKTAKYTIIGPMQLGAILGGADKTFLDKIDQFGEGLGIAFQIQDDSLGIFGNEKTIGKSVYSDIEEGKLTLLNIYAEQHCDSTQKQILDKYYGKGKIGQKELEQVRDVFIKTGALDYAQTEANKYIEKAKKLIPEIAKTPEHNRLLTEMADFLVKRKS